MVFTNDCLKSLRSDSYDKANVRELLAVLKSAKEEYDFEPRPLERSDIPKTPIDPVSVVGLATILSAAHAI